MSSPIPITTDPSHPSHPHPTLEKLPTSPASSLSISPQTPFFPPPGAPLSATTPTQPSTFLKWASGLSLGKSPVSPPGSSTKGFNVPGDAPPSANAQPHGIHTHVGSAIVMDDDDDHHSHEHHDAFEFGDLGDMRNKSWTTASANAAKGRRAVSMSMASGQNAGGSGITSMLTGFGSTAPGPSTAPAGSGLPRGAGLGSSAQASEGAGLATQPQNGVLADKAAKGQGLLRRFSIGGGLTRSGFLSSPNPSAHAAPNGALPTSLPAQPAAQPAQPDRDNGLKPPTMSRGRRHSETGTRKRGVSPMGERILRDHGSF